MKTAISIPDKIFYEAESLSKKLGVSRSELYVRAINEYLRAYRDESITAKLNELFEEQSEYRVDPGLQTLQQISLPADDWE